MDRDVLAKRIRLRLPISLAAVKLATVLTVYCLLGTLAVRADIVISGYSAATNDRFTNSSQFIAGGYNLSGIGQNGTGRWATLISRNVIVSANHFAPSGPITFFSSNNPASTGFSYTVTNSLRIGNSDIWLGRLNRVVDASISNYEFATEVLTGTNPNPNITLAPAGTYQNDVGWMVGLSPASRPAPQDQAFGRNRISGYSQNVSFLGGLTNALVLINDAPPTNNNPSNFVQYEAVVQSGDSGAPMFVATSATSLKLLGINSFLLTNSTTGAPVGSGVSYLGNSALQIQSFISVSTVPEPNAIFLVVFAGAAFYGRSKTIKVQLALIKLH